MAIKLKIIRMSIVSLAVLCFFPSPLQATELEMAATTGRQQIEVFRKGAPRELAHTEFVGVSMGAYRAVSDRVSWGAVAELTEPVGRDNAIGSGRILALRPVNFLYYWTPRAATEAYFGVARYDWINKASGYCFGANARYSMGDMGRFTLLLDAKYYSDLAHDGGPGGDQIVGGPSFGFGFLYRIAD
ncbi:MAG: hypothetical protein U5M23_03980 [Marinagarivorans sp.]|nr:hypothetical protein [Marinagarivorans sp.]